MTDERICLRSYYLLQTLVLIETNEAIKRLEKIKRHKLISSILSCHAAMFLDSEAKQMTKHTETISAPILYKLGDTVPSKSS